MLRRFDLLADQLVEQGDAGVAQASSTWFDLVTPTDDEDRSIERLLAIVLPTRAEMEEIELSARLYRDNGAEFMTITALANLDTEEPITTPVTFVLKGDALVTVRYAELKPFKAFLNRAQRPGSGLCSSSEQVMMSILEALIDRLADALERVGKNIDTVSKEVFRAQSERAKEKTRDLQAIIQHVGRKSELLAMIEESLVSISRLVGYHSAASGGAKAKTNSIGRVIQRDATSLGEYARALDDRISFLLNATLGLINLEQNQIIKIFSVVAVIFLPPTLVASIYGMNFAHMPELQWQLGYPMAIGLMVLSAILPYLFFKGKGWL